MPAHQPPIDNDHVKEGATAFSAAEIAIAHGGGDVAAPGWPRYHCHKRVSAAKIVRVHPRAAGGALLEVEGDIEPQLCEADMVRRYMPVEGDYLVVYDGDGYRSISPRGAFEDGYTRIDER